MGMCIPLSGGLHISCGRLNLQHSWTQQDTAADQCHQWGELGAKCCRCLVTWPSQLVAGFPCSGARSSASPCGALELVVLPLGAALQRRPHLGHIQPRAPWVRVPRLYTANVSLEDGCTGRVCCCTGPRTVLAGAVIRVLCANGCLCHTGADGAHLRQLQHLNSSLRCTPAVAPGRSSRPLGGFAHRNGEGTGLVATRWAGPIRLYCCNPPGSPAGPRSCLSWPIGLLVLCDDVVQRQRQLLISHRARLLYLLLIACSPIPSTTSQRGGMPIKRTTTAACTYVA
jgi:hypothetical protein